MSSTLEPKADPTTPSGPRRPYSPPRIEESGRFEQLVLRCSFTEDQAFCLPRPQFPNRMPRSL